MYNTFGAPLGAVASGGQSGVDSLMVRPIFPLKGDSPGRGVTGPVSAVPGGEKTPPAFTCGFSWATASGPGRKFRYVAIPRPSRMPSPTCRTTSLLRVMVQALLVKKHGAKPRRSPWHGIVQ